MPKKPALDELDLALGLDVIDVRKRRKRGRRPRKVNYTELLDPPILPEDRCPHSKRHVGTWECSQCLKVKATRVRPASVVPAEVDDE